MTLMIQAKVASITMLDLIDNHRLLGRRDSLDLATALVASAIVLSLGSTIG